jgi:predicted 3-demethylubiquinone-9 3-methyltransferase (glyoxalase superfamily)
MHKITPFLWFNGNLTEAIKFYQSVFKNVKVISSNNIDGKVFTATFEIEGQRFMALDGGPMFQFTEATSFFVSCKTQEEVDDLWGKLTADGGQESRCGWLKDKFGLSWQIIPDVLGELLHSVNPQRSQRVMQAMMKMNKIIIKDLQAAYNHEA